MKEITKLREEQVRLLGKWEVRGLWIWEKFRLDRLENKIKELEIIDKLSQLEEKN